MSVPASSNSSCRLADVLITGELARRPARRNFAAEARALAALVDELGRAPGAVPEKLTELVLEICHADSAGISILEPGPPEVFRWRAVRGHFDRNAHGGIPRQESPSAIAVHRNEVLLFRDSGRYFPRLRALKPRIHESLLAPFACDGRPVGTVWAIKHSPEGRFNAEDARLLGNVAQVAAAAHQAVHMRKMAQKARDASFALHPRLLQVSKMAVLGEVASGIAHELNQPLAAINTYAQACARLLTSPEPDRETLQSAMQEISAQTLRAADIIRSLRDLAATRAAESVRTGPNGTIAEVVDLLRADARSRNVGIVLRLARELPDVRIEHAQLQHVILNLVRNALEALESVPAAHREVAIETQLTAAQQVEMVVSDSGPGLPEAVRERLFDPFFSTKATGTGLGLPISHTIVRAHGGRLSYETSASGGACFRIALPRYDG